MKVVRGRVAFELDHQMPRRPAEGRPILSPIDPTSELPGKVAELCPQAAADPFPQVADRARSVLPGTLTISS